MIARFYFADGHVEWRDVAGAICTRRNWIITKLPPPMAEEDEWRFDARAESSQIETAGFDRVRTRYPPGWSGPMESDDVQVIGQDEYRDALLASWGLHNPDRLNPQPDDHDRARKRVSWMKDYAWRECAIMVEPGCDRWAARWRSLTGDDIGHHGENTVDSPGGSMHGRS